MNYNNAIKLLNSNKEKLIQKAFKLEKEFYQTKYKDNQINFSKRDYMDSYLERKSKKTSTNKFKFNSISSKNNSIFKKLNLSKEKEINQNEEEKIYDYNHTKRDTKSYPNTNKNNVENQNKKISIEFNNNTIHNLGRYTPNNIYFNYMKNIKNRSSKNKLTQSSTKEEYNNYVKQNIKERSKQLADSLASLNNYFEYQPLRNINSEIPDLNINPINLKRVAIVNAIKKNLFSFDDDDLLLHNVKKLKKEIRDVELKFYLNERLDKNYNLSFVKNNVRRSTLEKLNILKNSRFGVPC